VKTVLVVFCPFAAGYFLSFFFRNVNAIIAKDLASEFSLTASELGFLTSTYLLAFAAIQLPLGVLLDRYGPRRVVACLLCVAATGALIFGLARDLTMLSLGRALIGIGVSAGLMGAIKAFTLWFPLSRLATLNGAYLAVGGLGGLSATAPAEALIGELGWRALFYGLSAFALLVAVLVFTVVPEKKARMRAGPTMPRSSVKMVLRRSQRVSRSGTRISMRARPSSASSILCTRPIGKPENVRSMPIDTPSTLSEISVSCCVGSKVPRAYSA
jgi:MFS family permease